MKKFLNAALAYAVAAMAGGVFYREFTKFNGFTGRTALGLVHTHLFLLGMMVMLVAGLYFRDHPLPAAKKFKAFWGCYHIGVPLTAVMLLIRGVTQVLGLELSRGLDASISGVAGIGHILTGVGMICLLLTLRELAGEKAGVKSSEPV